MLLFIWVYFWYTCKLTLAKRVTNKNIVLLYCILLCGWLISRAVIGQFQVRKKPYGPLAFDHLFKTGIINKAI